MDQRTDYLVQILDKIGAPLIAGLLRGQNPALSDESMKSEAQTIAELLSRSVQMSIQIGKIMELDMSDPAAGDRFRLALMALAGPIVAAQYTQNGSVPGDAEQQKILTALEAILTFSDNFAASPENARHLEGQDDRPRGDDNEATLYSLRYFTGVINAIATFPFGQPEKKLMQDVTSRITQKAAELVPVLLPGAGPEQQGRGKLALIKALSEIYSQCHLAEMDRMLKAGDDPGPSGGMDHVWQNFEIRAAMLEALSGSLLPGDVAPAAAAAAPTETGPAPAAPLETPAGGNAGGITPPSIFQAKPKAENPETPAAPPSPTVQPQPAEPAPPPANNGSSGYNPMSMFSKKPSAEDSVAPPAPVLPSPPPAPPSPPEGDQAGTGSEDGSSSSDGDNTDGNHSGGGSGNPMSFFKKGNH